MRARAIPVPIYFRCKLCVVHAVSYFLGPWIFELALVPLTRLGLFFLFLFSCLLFILLGTLVWRTRLALRKKRMSSLSSSESSRRFEAPLVELPLWESAPLRQFKESSNWMATGASERSLVLLSKCLSFSL